MLWQHDDRGSDKIAWILCKINDPCLATIFPGRQPEKPEDSRLGEFVNI